MRKRIKKVHISKRTRNVLAISIIILIVPLTLFGISAFSPLTEEIYLKSGDIIKNFKFDTVGGKEISLGGNAWDGKLQFDVGSTWDVQRDDVQLISTVPVDDSVIYYYRVSMTNKINIFTKVSLEQGAENNLLKKETGTYEAAYYKHVGLTGAHMFSWSKDIYWQYYDFGDIKQWNLMNNKFSGDVVMSFDINPSSFPATITDSQGNIVTKNFDYIAVSSATVLSNTNGLLSDDMPSIIGIQPDEYETTDLPLDKPTNLIGGDTKLTLTFNPYIDLNIPRDPTNSFDGGIIPHSIGAGMQPKTKDGGNIWNPSINQESMTDCKFIYSLGSLSPVVYEWSGTLSYVENRVVTTDYWKIFPILWDVKVKSQTSSTMYNTQPVALHVTNRYIQSKVIVTLEVYSSYKVTTMDDYRDDPDLEAPTEYFDSLLWQSIVDGFGGGQQYTDTSGGLFDLGFDINSIIIIVVIIIVVIVGIYIFMKIGMPIVKGRQQRRLIESAVRAGRGE
ncbi:hypothetical protein LCGC14_1105070 [marine sediment metagenome]|uniref:Uncharacterized protein n=1 Tax=marine sediment metagenome TaxID=412755 RepID=A0A0F9MWC1_9ZZZZ